MVIVGGGMSGRPTEKYQCVSRPGECKFEWCCGPCCACNIPGEPKTEQARRDTAEAERRQHRWRAEDAVTKLGNAANPP
jgi:hypothetical protein